MSRLHTYPSAEKFLLRLERGQCGNGFEASFVCILMRETKLIALSARIHMASSLGDDRRMQRRRYERVRESILLRCIAIRIDRRSFDCACRNDLGDSSVVYRMRRNELNQPVQNAI